jgi:hypothetical protein
LISIHQTTKRQHRNPLQWNLKKSTSNDQTIKNIDTDEALTTALMAVPKKDPNVKLLDIICR